MIFPSLILVIKGCFDRGRVTPDMIPTKIPENHSSGKLVYLILAGIGGIKAILYFSGLDEIVDAYLSQPLH